MEIIEVDKGYTSKTFPFTDVMKVQETKDKSLCRGERRRNVFKDRLVNKAFFYKGRVVKRSMYPAVWMEK